MHMWVHIGHSHGHRHARHMCAHIAQPRVHSHARNPLESQRHGGGQTAYCQPPKKLNFGFSERQRPPHPRSNVVIGKQSGAEVCF